MATDVIAPSLPQGAGYGVVVGIGVRTNYNPSLYKI